MQNEHRPPPQALDHLLQSALAERKATKARLVLEEAEAEEALSALEAQCAAAAARAREAEGRCEDLQLLLQVWGGAAGV